METVLVIKGKTLKSKLNRLMNPPLTQMANEFIFSKKQEIQKYNWFNLPRYFKRRTIKKDQIEEIYVDEGNINGIRPPLLALFLNKGTASHFITPKRASVLHWQQYGKDYFSKGHSVKGIRAFNFWRFSSINLRTMNIFMKNWFKNVANG